MKLLILLIVILQISYILSYDLCVANPKKLALGSKCIHHSDCQLPLYCSNSKSVCSKPIENRDQCSDSRECGPYRICQNLHCKDILNIGDSCNENSYCLSSICINGKCAIDDKNCCVSQETCNFNEYCSMVSNNSTGKCKPVISDTSKCTNDYECPITHYCNESNQCTKKFSKALGTSCNASRECNVFKGHICDSTKKCSVYKDLLKKCSSSSDCGTGMCMCKSEGDNVCVEVQVGALPSDNCMNLFESFASCMKREHCLHNTPRCPKCFSIWMAYQYECYYINQFYRSGQDYYKSFWKQQQPLLKSK